MQETWVQSRDWEDPLEKEMATHSSILVWRIPWTTVHGVAKSRTRLSDFHFEGFPDSSVGKESTCNEGNLGLIPSLGRSAGEGITYPLHYSWASLVAQLVKNPPAMQETWACCLGWEYSLEKRKANHSSILAWTIPWTVYTKRSQRVRHD